MSKLTELSDEEIIALVRGDDVDAYGEIMVRYEAKLTRYVIYLIHDAMTASDIVQETFIKAYQNAQGFNPKYKFSSWIYRIAHNEAMNAVKRDKHITHDLDVEEVREAAYETTTIRDIDRSILKNDMQACLDSIELKYREVLMLQYYEHMKYDEIADVLHVPPATVGVWAARGKAKLRVLCEKKGVHV
jgi:RNA polymerase sigma-70 factor, ECF subfamily